MATTEKIKKARAHQQYRLADGTRVPGVTTITGILAKRALINWANRIGLEGIEVGKYVDSLADIGTLTHHRVECDFTGVDPDLSEASPKDLELSDNSMLSYYTWRSGHTIETIENELQMISEKYRYGGTCDIYCRVDGEPELVDIKTGKAIYSDMLIQLAAYWHLLEESGRPVKRARILNIPRTENESFDEKILTDKTEYLELFLTLRKVYDLKGKLKIW